MGKKKRRKEKGEICWRTHGPHQCFLLPPFSFLIFSKQVDEVQVDKKVTEINELSHARYYSLLTLPTTYHLLPTTYYLLLTKR